MVVCSEPCYESKQGGWVDMSVNWQRA